MLRGLVLIELAVCGHGRTCDEAKRRFEKMLSNHNDHGMNPNVRAAIYFAVAKRGDAKTFQQLKSVSHRRTTMKMMMNHVRCV